MRWTLVVLALVGSCWAHTVTLNWKPSTTTGVTYSIYRSTTPGANYVRRAANQKLLTWTDLTVKNGKTYFYVVRAVKKTVESDNSNEVKAVIPKL